nr:hypothetical protein [Tanacetum cinerariifolium]
ECGNSLNDFFCPDCTCEFCGNGAHVGSYCQAPPSILQQLPCCEDCGVTHEHYQCQPENHHYYDEQHDYYDEQYSCFDYNSSPLYNVQPPQYNAPHALLNAHNKLMEQMTSMCEMKQEEKRIQEEQAAKARYWKIPACCDDDDDDDSAITPILSIEEPIDSLSIGDEHLDTIPATKSDEVIKSSVEDL